MTVVDNEFDFFLKGIQFYSLGGLTNNSLYDFWFLVVSMWSYGLIMAKSGSFNNSAKIV